MCRGAAETARSHAAHLAAVPPRRRSRARSRISSRWQPHSHERPGVPADFGTAEVGAMAGSVRKRCPRGREGAGGAGWSRKPSAGTGSRGRPCHRRPETLKPASLRLGRAVQVVLHGRAVSDAGAGEVGAAEGTRYFATRPGADRGSLDRSGPERPRALRPPCGDDVESTPLLVLDTRELLEPRASGHPCASHTREQRERRGDQGERAQG